jgi:hypothetical protein
MLILGFVYLIFAYKEYEADRYRYQENWGENGVQMEDPHPRSNIRGGYNSLVDPNIISIPLSDARGHRI